MAKFQIPLNGSNIVSNDRKKAFQDALNDEHKIECQDQEPLIVSKNESSAPIQVSGEQKRLTQPSERQGKTSPVSTERSSSGLDQVLDHSYSHQARTMEIHQQYLAQQAENIQLITAVLNQQGKVLDQNNGAAQAQIIETFQRTLDNFHLIRERGLTVHQEFLARQAEFSERYLSFLENNGSSVKMAAAPEQRRENKPTEWVVHVPPIVLDEHASPKQDVLVDDTPPDTLREVNLATLPERISVSTDDLSRALLDIVAEKTGYPADMLELNMDLEADLGIDSIKRVEILGALEEKFPSLPAADTEVLAQTRTLQEIIDYMNTETSDPAPAQQADSSSKTTAAEVSDPPLKNEVPSGEPTRKANDSASSTSGITAILLEIVAEKTGYPVEMLEADMDMEADLGIDSIKRVEILGVMEERVPGLPTVDAETLAELRTLGQIAALMGESQQAGEEVKPADQDVKKKVNPVTLQNTPVQSRALPSPDRLEFSHPVEDPVIITNDGSAFTAQVISQMRSDGWKVALWDFPTSLIKPESQTLPNDIYRITQEGTGKESIDSALETLREELGKPAGFIHLHPSKTGNGIFSENESELVKQVFLIAGSLKVDLTRVDPDTRRIFMAVTRTGGNLGLSSNNSFQEGSGLSGLVKSLHWEWPDVFCRLVDLNQEIEIKKASKLIIQEIHDPARELLEVGLSESARSTLVRENN